MTTEELLAELEALAAEKPQGEPDCFTTTSLAELKGCGEKRARLMAKAWTKLGRVQPEMVLIVNDWGETQRVKGYRILPAKP